MNAAPLALVLGGGGARAAYQVGVLSGLAEIAPQLDIPILTGVSAGAINTAFLASRVGTLAQVVAELEDLWRGLTTDRVFESRATSMLGTASRWGLRLVSGGAKLGTPTRGMVDTAPLRRFLEDAIGGEAGRLRGIEENLRKDLEAVALTTTDYGTGRSITWVESNDAPGWERPKRRSVETQLGLDHVMASAALPLFFPAVQIGDSWHGDGGIRLTAPLSPALHLGAGRILAISTRYGKTSAEAERSSMQGYPPPAQVIGVLLNALFLDMLDQDALNLARINQLVSRLPTDQRGTLRPVELLILRPTKDLAVLASQFEPSLPQPFRFLMRGLGTRETRSPDSLSMVMFETQYLQHLIEVGLEDTRARAERIAAFLAGEESEAFQQTGFWKI